MIAEADFRKQVKDALEHLYDTAHLASHPLLSQLTPPANANTLSRAHKLRSVLKEAIEALRPQETQPSSAPEWRSYLALRFRYVQGMSLGQVEAELGVSLRQLQRELHKGLDAVTVLLAEQAAAVDPSQGDLRLTASPNEMGEVEALRTEMLTWQLAREACEVRSLLDDAQWMLRSSLGPDHPGFRLDLPAALPPILVDATLMRQALFHALRLCAQGSHGRVTLSASSGAGRIEIRARAPGLAPDPQANDWQVAQLLFEKQGASLAAEATSAAACLVIGVPPASPPRVLVIDDNQAIHQLLERYLAPHFYEVAHVYSGPEAHQAAVAAQPDVILLDVMMPTVDGWQVLRALKAQAQTAAIPVIVCSVLKEPELAASLGAHAYLKKPVDRLELLAVLAGLPPQAAPAAADPPANP
jgi:CheY-like chemotaxis protein